MNYNTIIIGAGISGMTAAIYLKRANIDVCIFEKSAPGGQLLRTSIVENYPAFPKVEGSTLAMNIYNQVTELKIPIIFEEVQEIINQDTEKVLKTTKTNYTCQNIIIATGRIYRKLNLENEEKLTGRGISYCAICDGALYKEKDVAVVGAGNSAFEEALYLSNLCQNVTIISRRDEFRAEESLTKKVKNTKNIKLLTNTTIEQIKGKEQLDALLLKNQETGEEQTLKVDGCFIYIGQTPETAIIQKLGLKIKDGYIVTEQTMKTNIKNIYACGDCRQKELYQLVTATYDGAVAASTIIKEKEITN